MKKKMLFLAGTVFLSVNAYSQVGINTSTPSSTLDIKGAIEGNFREITGTSTLDNQDYHVSFSGTSDAILNLPTKSTTDGGVSDFRGRKYYIKNNSLSSKLSLTAAAGQTIRLGGSGTAANTLDLKPGTFGFLTANGVNGWDLDFVATAYNNNWMLANSEVNGPPTTATSQVIPSGTSTFTVVNGCAVTVTVPSGVASSKVVLNFTGWGDAVGSTNSIGSFRFQIVRTGTSTATYASAMMTSWAVGSAALVRYNYPVVYSISNLAPGTYTFTLQVRREDESGTGITTTFWGTMGRADVYVKE
ncbi:hypothetical protein [Chryseobacterium lathyri]|uniref:DUF5017 domain-containing protein n=1 Tax=Chryseobacterium lathyri TaxID=395933 RepID=A0ABT9SQT9_9FLAO|nr:hypothetical protein [Chryseobacterium lathyri]MDP9961166.1 hypothetical protein [Chryseobacterium lathyri]MDQ0067834.1 hypothetical protein [Chryseobacterium lathyri]